MLLRVSKQDSFLLFLDAAESCDMQGMLFQALRKTRLVPENADWESMQYSRGGRTDKGVSGVGQARVSIQLLLTLNLCLCDVHWMFTSS